MFERVRLICFDLDDTLWPCHPVIRAAEAECYAWLQRFAPRLTAQHSPQQLREHRLALAARYPEIAYDLTEVRLRSLAALMRRQGYAQELADQACSVFRRARNRVAPYAEVGDNLARLRPHYTLVSVTNGNSQIEQTPLAESFDHSLTAAEVGAAKPDPALFLGASRSSGIALEAALHVGDDPLRDVQAARTLGMATVWVNRAARPWPDELPRADLEVAELGELTGRLIG